MDGTHIRNFKDFLLLYNQISEACFKRCTNIFISRDVSNDEDICLRKCLQKHIQANHKMMEIFMEVQPIFVRKRIEEAQAAQAALEAQAAQAALEPQAAPAALEPQAAPAALEPQAAQAALEPQAAPAALEPQAAPAALEPQAAQAALEPQLQTEESVPKVAA